jgi:hypothetical protein
MKLFGWFGTQKRNRGLDDWRRAWAEAINAGGSRDADLRARLDTLAATEPDVEVELEMLDALEQLRQVQGVVGNGQMPSVETQHRVIAGERCHFTAPATMPTDHTQSSGRVLLTASRAIFVGAGKTSTTAWHMVHEVARVDREVLLARSDGTPLAHFGFNNYGDAVLCAFLAGRLKPSKRGRL